MMSETEPSRDYAVSYGNGNDGVSRLYPAFIVTTSDPWRLARLAALSEIKPAGWKWAVDSLEVDGEADYGISATFLDPPADTPDGFPAARDDEDDPEEEDNGSWCDHNGAWMITEVFPADGAVSDRSECPRYASLEEAFSADLLARVGAED